MKNTWNSQIVGRIPNSNDLKINIGINDFGKEVIENSKIEIKNILSWKSKKKLLIIWPCSADFEESLLEYGSFIKSLRDKYSSNIEIVMRFYTGKPRTIWWWKWLSNSNPWDEANIVDWITNSRILAIKLIEMWIPLADEMLHPQLSSFFDDIYSYLAIWARSTENQYHREVASWSDIPIGFKNPTSGDIETMVNSISAWQNPSDYTLWDDIYKSSWNNFSHGILRWWRIGWKNFSNYWTDDISLLGDMLTKWKVKNPAFIVDTNHENSNKDHKKQIKIMKSVFDNLKILSNDNSDVLEFFKWFMVESYLFEWRQNWTDSEQDLVKWLSLTDPCIWKEQTEEFVYQLSENIKKLNQSD